MRSPRRTTVGAGGGLVITRPPRAEAETAAKLRGHRIAVASIELPTLRVWIILLIVAYSSVSDLTYSPLKISDTSRQNGTEREKPLKVPCSAISSPRRLQETGLRPWRPPARRRR